MLVRGDEEGMTCQHLKTKSSPITALTLCEVCGEPIPGANLLQPLKPTWVPAGVLAERRKAAEDKGAKP